MSLSLLQKMSVNKASTERQERINYFGCCISYNPRAVLQLLPIIEVLAASIGNTVNVDAPSPDNGHQQRVNRGQQRVNRGSTEPQQSLNRGSTDGQQSVNRASTEGQQMVNRASTEHQQSINRASTEHQQSINRASTEFQQSWILHLV
jgi:hypothetical protein